LLDYLFLKLSNDLQLIASVNPMMWVCLLQILAIGALSAASSTAAVAILLAIDVEFCRVYPYLTCIRYKVSVILASMAWSFIVASAGSTFWLLVSLSE
jgi:hypothetical protein